MKDLCLTKKFENMEHLKRETKITTIINSTIVFFRYVYTYLLLSN